MRKARVGALLLLFALPCAAQRGGEPELIPRFAPLKKLPAADPLKPVRRPVDLEEAEPAYKILPPPNDLMRKPRTSELGAKAENREILALRSRAWFYRAALDTRYSEPVAAGQATPAGVAAWTGETNETRGDGFMAVNSAELAPLNWLSLQAEYGRQTTHKGRYTEREWVHAPDAETVTSVATGESWSRPSHEDDTRYGAKARGAVEWAAANLYLRVIEARIVGQDDDSFRHAFDLGVGVHRLRHNMRLTEFERTLSLGKIAAAQPLGPLAGYDWRYEAQWRGPHVAMRETVRFPAYFGIEGEAFWSPGAMEYRGDGYDNVAAGLRAEPPNFEDRARGSAIHMRFAASWAWKGVRVEGGWQRLYFYSRTGKRRYHQLGGVDQDYQLDFATTELSGLFAGASVRF